MTGGGGGGGGAGERACWKCGPIDSELLGCQTVHRSIHWNFQRNGSSSPAGFINA